MATIGASVAGRGVDVRLSIIIPVHDDAPALRRLLSDLTAGGPDAEAPEIVVVDGGSSDSPQAVCESFRCHNPMIRCLQSSRGRGEQLAAGIAASSGEVLWLLHADSRVDAAAVRMVMAQREGWGRCRLRFEPHLHGMRMVAFFMNWRSRLTGICTGDQGMWMMRSSLLRAGGMPRQPLMEDIELSRRLKSTGWPRVLATDLRTSPRRWQSRGLWRTIFSMWGFRLRYFFGASPEMLASRYRRAGSGERRNE